MDCLLSAKDGAETLLEYCSGSLDATRAGEFAAEFESHVAECADCRRMVDAQREVWSALDQWTGAPSFDPASFDQRLYVRVAREDAAPWWRKAWDTMFHPAMPWEAWKPAASLAAACAVVALGLLVRFPQASDTAKARVEAVVVDMDQVEQALEDLDMLTPVAPVAASAM